MGSVRCKSSHPKSTEIPRGNLLTFVNLFCNWLTRVPVMSICHGFVRVCTENLVDWYPNEKSALAPMNKFVCKLHGYIVYLFNAINESVNCRQQVCSLLSIIFRGTLSRMLTWSNLCVSTDIRVIMLPILVSWRVNWLSLNNCRKEGIIGFINANFNSVWYLMEQ